MFLFEALQSCFTQTLPPAEVLLVDDGSDDPKTGRFLTQVQSGFDTRLKVLFMGHHVGISHCLNIGLINAQNDWIARMDADDIMMPHRLERQASAFHLMETDLLSSQSMNFGTQPVSFTSYPLHANRTIALEHDSGRFTNDETSIYHRHTVLHLGGYDSAHDGYQDVELWYRMIANGRKITTLSDVLQLRRLIPDEAPQRPNSVNLHLFKSYLLNEQRFSA